MTDENYIALICNGGFDVIPDISIGELFEAYFDNINYNVVKESNRVFVDFTGVTIYENREENITIRFYINPNNEEFAIVEVRVAGELLDEDDVIELLDDIEFVGKTIIEDQEPFSENDIYFESDIEEIDDEYYDDNDEFDDIDDIDDIDDEDEDNNDDEII